MAAVAYPAGLPVSCGSEIVRIVTSKRIVEERAQFGHCLWVCQGFLQSVVLGNPPEHDHAFSAVGDEDEQLTAVYDALSPLVGFGAGSEDAAITPAEILVVVQLVLKLIELFRKGR